MVGAWQGRWRKREPRAWESKGVCNGKRKKNIILIGGFFFFFFFATVHSPVHCSSRAKIFKFGSTIATYFLELVVLKKAIWLFSTTNVDALIHNFRWDFEGYRHALN